MKKIFSMVRYVPYLLLGIFMMLLLLFALVPFFLSGLHQLSPSEIVEVAETEDFSWYPLYGEKGLKSEVFGWGLVVTCFSPFLAVVLLMGVGYEIASTRHRLGRRGKIWRSLLLASLVVLGMVTLVYSSHLATWFLWDLD